MTKLANSFNVSVRIRKEFLQVSLFLDLDTEFQNLSNEGVSLVISYKVVNSFPV